VLKYALKYYKTFVMSQLVCWVTRRIKTSLSLLLPFPQKNYQLQKSHFSSSNKAGGDEWSGLSYFSIQIRFWIVEIVLGWPEQDYQFLQANQPEMSWLNSWHNTWPMFLQVSHLIFLICASKNKHLAHVCGGIKMLKRNVWTTLPLA